MVQASEYDTSWILRCDVRQEFSTRRRQVELGKTQDLLEHIYLSAEVSVWCCSYIIVIGSCWAWINIATGQLLAIKNYPSKSP